MAPTKAEVEGVISQAREKNPENQIKPPFIIHILRIYTKALDYLGIGRKHHRS
jgi:hypothetical protein